jgi:mannose-6-phosphate isomerase-like protein (cupin superfamily)
VSNDTTSLVEIRRPYHLPRFAGLLALLLGPGHFFWRHRLLAAVAFLGLEMVEVLSAFVAAFGGQVTGVHLQEPPRETGLALSGAMRIFMDDGSETEVKAGDVFAIPPGHDADVPGPEACVMVDFGEIGDYAKRG